MLHVNSSYDAIGGLHGCELKIVNLTPHTVNVIGDNGEELLAIPSSGVVRCEEDVVLMGFQKISDDISIPVVEKQFRQLDKPELLAEGFAYIVSQPVQDWYYKNTPDRSETIELLVPYDLVRDATGRIIGCRGFSV